MRSLSTKRVNEETLRTHRWQTFWQILLPILLGIILAGLLLVLILRGGDSGIERSAQTATILLTIPIVITGAVFLFLVVLLSSMLGRLMNWLPPKSYRAQKLAQKISLGVTKGSRTTEQPFLLLESWGEALRRIFQRISS